MSPHITTTVIVLKTLTLITGGLITYFAYKAYRRTEAQALGALASGFGVITFGALLAGVLDRVLQVSSNYALIAESLLTFAGFAIILYSLYGRTILGNVQ